MNLPIDYKLYYDEPNFHRSNNLIQLPEGVRSRSHKASGKRDKLLNQNKGQEQKKLQPTRGPTEKITAAIISSVLPSLERGETCKDISEKEK